ncbi:MAG: hypothetical protein CL840_17755 [Crocinitomicaceae bacterium]|nr:hypothetical protein [Crocinitomicaceae bacterium]|tara:strand:+ start:13484 stop:14164 length:681 start_codon:yes stop_codon:yes gene_type:complete
MCGRYVQVSPIEKIEEKFGVIAEVDVYQPNYNIGPTHEAPIICSDAPKKLLLGQFGYRPSYDPSRLLLNARDDRLMDLAEWSQAYTFRRCLIPATCFYEGPQKEKLAKPHAVYLRNTERPFAFAGLYRDVESDEGIFRTFGIITTRPSSAMKAIGHHRAPVILRPDDYKVWLDNDKHLSQYTVAIGRNENEKMNAYPVSPEMRSGRINARYLLDPIGPRVLPEHEN